MSDYELWALTFPDAAKALALLHVSAAPSTEASFAKSEAWAQQADRMTVARAGGLMWRNNVGATPAKCPDCEAPQRPIRYGLANDSHQLNEQFKSSDLIGLRPVLITLEHVGQVLGQFVAIESKHPGWVYTGKGREGPQQAFLSLVTKHGGFAKFSTGGIEL